MVVSLKSVMDLENMQNIQEHNEVPSPWYMTYKGSISVLVRNPIVHYSWNNGHYTSYAINIETNHIAFTLKHSVSRRRYSEFVYLRKLLKQQHPTLTPPPLPPKTFFNNASTNFLEKRRLGLQEFLEKLMEIPMFVSNRAMHLFLQSSYPMHKIANMVGFEQNHSDEMEPHLSLSHLFPEEDPMMRLYNADVPDFDILGSLHNHNHNHGYSSSRRNSFSQAICTRCGLPRNQLQLTHGSQITLYQPTLTLTASDICDGHSPPVEMADSDYNSSINTASLNNYTPCSSATVHSLEVKDIPKKKVSFSSEVTVAQFLSHDK